MWPTSNKNPDGQGSGEPSWHVVTYNCGGKEASSGGVHGEKSPLPDAPLPTGGLNTSLLAEINCHCAYDNLLSSVSPSGEFWNRRVAITTS